MIRRHAGDRHQLISQNDHALLSGQLAAFFGNAQFAPPDPLPDTLAAIALHDCGWPAHDSSPTINKDNLPLDVFETPLSLALDLWSAAADRAAAATPYTQLLVSLHIFGLSAFAATNSRTRREMFELNQFQQRQIELQERLRAGLGLTAATPLRFGLALTDDNPAEARLRHNHNVLQFMDRLSLALCCTNPPFTQIENTTPRPGPERIIVHFTRPTPTELIVDPWPFNPPELHVSIPCRSVPAHPYDTDQQLRAAVAAAPVQKLMFTVRRCVAQPAC